MSYTPGFYTGDGATTQYVVPFSFLSRDDITFTVAGVAATYTWISDGLVTATTAPGAGTRVVIRRVTPGDPIVNFTNGALLAEADLDTAKLQAMYLAQEADFRATDRTLHISDADGPSSLNSMPAAASRASRTLIFDGDGQPIAGPTSAEILAANGQAIAAAASAAAAAVSAAAAAVSAAKIPLPVSPGDNGKLVRVAAGTGGTYELATAPGGGDTVGAASSTDRALALFSGVGGKTLKNGPALGTSGHVLKSQGAGADPVFGQLEEASIAANAVAVAALKREGTSGHVLTSNGAGSDPSFQALPAAGEANTASNLSGGGSSLFSAKSGVDLQFRQLKVATSTTNAGSTNNKITAASLSIVQNTNDVTVTLNITKNDDAFAVGVGVGL